ncbi:unnamed protein product [Gordionus sp. m RMFG-2023]|uniref:N(G),N(G)-dimethylarginine dimethylaminohydrolase 1-like n=1 Tax=Gordionus sp. m RMFG-2023 TaxID=3053472 RepID=UPI0030E3DA7E
MNFKYTHAIVSRIPKSICSIGQPQIDIYRAKKEFEQYVKLLRKIGLDVIELAAEETLPYSAFTGDIGIGVNGMAFLYNSKISQAKEKQNIKNIISKELNMEVYEILDEDAFIDANDVLFTGREFFIGITANTNEKGAKIFANTFPDYSCSLINFKEKNSNICLKYYVNCLINEDILIYINIKGNSILKQMEMKASYKYKILILPLDLINCLYINGSFMCSNDKEEDLKLIEEKLGFKQDLVDLTELSKLHGNLSRLVLLIGKQKIVK